MNVSTMFAYLYQPSMFMSLHATRGIPPSFHPQVVDASGQVSGERHYIDNTVGFKHVGLQLPEDVSCTQCVLQWTYNTGKQQQAPQQCHVA